MLSTYLLASACAALAPAQASTVTDIRPPIETPAAEAGPSWLSKVPTDPTNFNFTAWEEEFDADDFDPGKGNDLMSAPDERLVGQHFLIGNKFYMKIRNIKQARLVKSYYKDHLDESQAQLEHALAAKSEDAELLETLREAGDDDDDDSDDEDEDRDNTSLASNSTAASNLSRRGQVNKKPHLPSRPGAAIPILKKALKQSKAKKHRQKAAKGRKKAFHKKKANKALMMLQSRLMKMKHIAEVKARARKIAEDKKRAADEDAKKRADNKKKFWDTMVQYYKYKYIKQHVNKVIAGVNACPQYAGKCCAEYDKMGISLCDGPLGLGRLGIHIPGHDCGESTFGPGISSGAADFQLKDKNGKKVCPKINPDTGKPYHIQILKPFGPNYKRSVPVEDPEEGEYSIDLAQNFDTGVPPIEEWDWGNDDDDDSDEEDAAENKVE